MPQEAKYNLILRSGASKYISVETGDPSATLAAQLDLGWRSRESRNASSTMIGAPTTAAVINTPPYTINNQRFL
jgi:hypothetical protein